MQRQLAQLEAQHAQQLQQQQAAFDRQLQQLREQQLLSAQSSCDAAQSVPLAEPQQRHSGAAAAE